jgi:hypothetical protein
MTATLDSEAVASLLTAANHAPNLSGAACRDRAAWFDPPADAPDRDHRLAVALRICERCPVAVQCRKWFASLDPSERPTDCVIAGSYVPPDHDASHVARSTMTVTTRGRIAAR